EAEAAHVGDVENPGGGPDRFVFGDDAGVLHRHVPAAERHHAGLVVGVPLVEGGAAVRHGYQHVGLTARRSPMERGGPDAEPPLPAVMVAAQHAKSTRNRAAWESMIPE